MQNSRGDHIELGQMIKSGGEAKIFEVRNQLGLLAKVYHAGKLRAEQEEKLKAMLANRPIQTTRHTILAWPLDLLYERGRLLGFLMSRIKAYDRIFNFYNPRLRKRRHPAFNLHYLHHVAANCAVAVESVHQAGHLVGDLNESNVLVSDRALVALVDTDSFQIKGPKERIYRCVVGKPEYIPPELQGLSLSSVNRRPEHDYFGLAVLIFQLLMQGYHPFSGVLPADLSVGRVDVYGIKEGLFPYHQDSNSASIQTPPNAPSFAHLHPDVQALFIRCFVDGHKNPSQRPTTGEWRRVLRQAEQELFRCYRNTAHIYSNHLASCPFCRQEETSQISLPPATLQPLQRMKTVNTRTFSSKARTLWIWSKATFSFLASFLIVLGLFLAILVNYYDPGPSFPIIEATPFGAIYPEPVSTMAVQNVAQIEQLTYFGKGQVKDAVYSADGKWLAVASSIGVSLYNVQALDQMHLINVGASVHRVAVSPDGQLVASASDDNKVRLWSIDGELLESFSGYSSSANVAFSPDGLQLVLASKNHEVHLWSVNERVMKRLSGHSDNINNVTFSPDGSLIASASADKTVRLWNRRGELIQIFSAPHDQVNHVAFSPDGQQLAFAFGKMVHLWSTEGEFVNRLSGHTDAVHRVAFSPDGKTIASTSSDHTVRLWERSGTPIITLSEHTDTVRSVAFSPNSKRLVSTSNDNTVRVWSASGRLIVTMTGYTNKVSSIALSSNGALLAAAEPEIVRLWAMDGTIKKEISESKVESVAFSPDASLVATASDNEITRLWSVEELFGSLPRRAAYPGLMRSVAFGPNGTRLASIGASNDHTVHLWSTDGAFTTTFFGHTMKVLSVTFSPDGEALASTSEDQTIRLWSIKGELLETYSGHTSRVWSVAFSPDGQILASASDDQTVRLWFVKNETPRLFSALNTLKGHRSAVRRVAFSPDGTLIASASSDKTVRLWSLDGELLNILTGHTAIVTDVAFSADGKTLASASWDGTVRLWGVRE